MTMNRFFQTAGTLVLTAVFGLCLAACGGSDSDDDNNDNGSGGNNSGPTSSFTTRELIGWYDLEDEVEVYIKWWERDLQTMKSAGDTNGYRNYVNEMPTPNYLALRFIDGERVEYTTVITVEKAFDEALFQFMTDFCAVLVAKASYRHPRTARRVLRLVHS